MSIINGTLILMNDGEEIFIHHTKDEVNAAIDEALSIRRNYITISHLDRDIHFNYIKDKKSLKRDYGEQKKISTHTKLLEMGSIEKKKLKKENPTKYYQLEKKEEEERAEKNKIIRDILDKSYDKRRANFIEERKNIFKKLAEKERNFELETTVDKLEDLNNFRKIKMQKDAR